MTVIGQGDTVGARGDAMQRAARAWHLRVLGKTWTDIAREVGFANDANAIRAVRRFVGRLPEPSPEETRTIWRDRMEYLWGLAARDAEAGRPGALRAGVAVAQRAAQLDGLDAPREDGIHATDAEIDRLVQALASRLGGGQAIEADVLELEVLDTDDA